MLRKNHLILILIVISITAIGADSIQKRQNTSQGTATAPVSPQVTTVAIVSSVVGATTQGGTTSAAQPISVSQPTSAASTSISSAAPTTTQPSVAASTTITTSQGNQSSSIPQTSVTSVSSSTVDTTSITPSTSVGGSSTLSTDLTSQSQSLSNVTESPSGVTTDTNTSIGTTNGESKSSKTEEFSTSIYTPPMQTTSTVSVCSNSDCQVDTTINTSVSGNITTITAPPDTGTAPVTTITQSNSDSNVKSTVYVTTTYLTTITEFYPGYTTTLRSTGTNGVVTTYATYVPPSTVVVVKTITAAVQENLVASGNIGLEALNGIAISLCLIGITFVYMILA